jgi:putative transposase
MSAEPPISEKEVEKLQAKIGQLVVERRFFGRCLQSYPRHWRQKSVKHDQPEMSVRRQRVLLSL